MDSNCTCSCCGDKSETEEEPNKQMEEAQPSEG